MSAKKAHSPKAQAPVRDHQERCMICKKLFPRILPGHLREHGFTVHRYERMYGVRALPMRSERIDVGSPTDPNPDLIAVIAERLTEDKAWVACISDEVGERMLTGPLKQRMSVLLTTMLAQRAKVHGESMAILSGALAELQQDWRLAHGGEDHGPTPTDVLLRIVEKAAKVVRDSEEAVQRTMKLALEEQRTAKDYADGVGAPLYSGTGETLDMPAGVTSGDRENIRQLLNMVGKYANDAGTVDAEVVSSSEALPRVPPTPPGAPTPTDEDCTSLVVDDANVASPPSEGTDPSSDVSAMPTPHRKRRRRRRPRPPTPPMT